MAEDLAWTDYRETVYGADQNWMRAFVIANAIANDPTVAPWDDFRILERDGGLQVQIRRH